MKSHTAADIKCGVEHGWPADDRYYSRADLIAAGCLVPVPDGEVCMACESGTHGIITIPDRAGVFRRTGYGGGKNGSYVIFSDAAEDEEVRVPVDTIVQPVRLVRLEDVG